MVDENWVNPDWTPEEIAGVKFCEDLAKQMRHAVKQFANELSYGLPQIGISKESHQLAFWPEIQQPCGHRESRDICYDPFTKELGYRAQGTTGNFVRPLTAQDAVYEVEANVLKTPERRMRFIRQIHPAILEAMIRGGKAIPRREIKSEELFIEDIVWNGASELWTPDETALAVDIVKGKVEGISPYFTMQMNEFADLEGDLTDCLCCSFQRDKYEANRWLEKQNANFLRGPRQTPIN